MTMMDATVAAVPPKTIYREDYEAPAFGVDHVDLDFQLHETRTIVSSTLALRRTEHGGAKLVLDGEDLILVSIAMDGTDLEADHYQQTETGLEIPNVPDSFTLNIVTQINPAANTRLAGLYLSGGNFCTQCESQDFRRITFFPDRPDVMTTYSVRIEAEKSTCPVLLSNGNRVEGGDLDGGRHWVRWDDPFRKPSYLFGLVAGDLQAVHDQFTTRSGRVVDLYIYVRAEDLGKCDHAMAALKRAMAWDEEVYGLEYDLDIFNIVAVSDFNMGAMENKSLNIFNTKCVLASPETATDYDYDRIEGIIAHEYFHNWTGNRVTCRDWFQLSLKEGLTVFRDQEYSSDVGSRALKRIEDVRLLRAHQFPEDDGPTAHSVRPDSCIEINNFYTSTVYNKGAEVIRMMHTLLGPRSYHKGIDLYFERHDGSAVTCDDFAAALADASGIDLDQFKLWYSQAGTPVVKVRSSYDEEAREFRLTLSQSCPATPGQPNKKPMHMPVRVGLVGPNGDDLLPELTGDGSADGSGFILNLREAEQTFSFGNVATRPVPSLLRGFSAPISLDDDLTNDDRAFLLAHDSDSFARWEAGQTLALGMLLGLLDDLKAGRSLQVPALLIQAIGAVLDDRSQDPALVAEAALLPSELYVAQVVEHWDVAAIHQVREFMKAALGAGLHSHWRSIYDDLSKAEQGDLGVEARARRRLKNVALSYLVAEGDTDGIALADRQFRQAGTMTDAIAALSALADHVCPERDQALRSFYDKWHGDDLVLDKWFTVQALSSHENTLSHVRDLMTHEAFTLKNPNRLRSLIGAFTTGNPVRFHAADGAGYHLLADVINDLDKLNPLTAAMMLAPLGRFKKLDEGRRSQAILALKRIVARKDVSKDVFEIASKSLDQA